MKLLRCPLNGLRPLQEFQFGGEFRLEPQKDEDDTAWADYVFNRQGAPRVALEWWYHLASGTWFLAERNTMTDEIIRTGLFEEFFPRE